MTLLDTNKPLPDEIWIYTCSNCDDEATYLDKKAALYQCWRHDHKSRDCSYRKHMRVAHYKKLKDIEVTDASVLGY